MRHLEVSCAVRRFFRSLGFKGLTVSVTNMREVTTSFKKYYTTGLLPNFVVVVRWKR